MKKILFLSFLALGITAIHAQNELKVWTRLAGTADYDFGFAVATDPFGNVVTAGATRSSLGGPNAGRYDLFVAKYDAAGNRLWLRQRGTSEREFAYGVATDAAGNIYATGYTGAGLDGNSNIGNWDIFVVKFDSSGNWQWTKQDGTGQDDEGRAVCTDSSGNVYVTGYVRGNFHGIPRVGTADVFISKYNSAGTRLWSALFGSPEVDESFGITCDASGNVFVTGWCSGSIEGNPYLANGDNYLVKYDSNGQRQWLNQWGTYNKDTGYSLATDASGNVYISGYSTGPLYGSPLGERDVFLAKFNAAGTLVWGKKIGTTGHDQGWGIAADPAGYLYAAGETSGPLDGNDYQGDLDVFLTKYDFAGNWLATYQFGTTNGEAARGVTVGTNGNIYIGGWTYGDLDGNVNNGSGDAFVTRYAQATALPPPAPVALSGTGVTSNAFTANWSSVGNATGYQLDVSTTNTFDHFLTGYQNLDVGNVTNRNVTGLTPAATYYYRVRAYNTNGVSGNSGIIAATLGVANPCVGILNPDFEGGFSLAGGGYIGNEWTEWQADPGVVIGYDEIDIIHGGSHSQRIRVSGGATGSSGGVYQQIPVIAGTPYTVSVWVYAGDAQAACSLGVDPSGGTDPSSGVTWSSASTNAAWVQKTWMGTPMSSYLTVYLRVASSDDVKRNGYFDDALPAVPTGPLPLAAQLNGNALTLTWPRCPEARLERADSLSPPIAWDSVTNQVNLIGDQKTVTLIPIGGAGYFRLVQE